MKPTQIPENLESNELLKRATDLLSEVIAAGAPGIVITAVNDTLKFAGVNTSPAEMYQMLRAPAETLAEAYNSDADTIN